MKILTIKQWRIPFLPQSVFELLCHRLFDVIHTVDNIHHAVIHGINDVDSLKHTAKVVLLALRNLFACSIIVCKYAMA